MEQARGAFRGHAPALLVGAANPEQKKYERMWELPQYRAISPGEQTAQIFLKHARPTKGSTVIDFGCGTGRGALMLAVFGGVKVIMVDFAKNCLDEDIAKALITQADVLSFVRADLERPLPVKVKGHFGFCADVMEHIPTDKVVTVLRNVMQAAQHVFFQICLTDDSCGKLIDEPLHLTVQSFEWWLQRLGEAGAIVHWSDKDPQGIYAYFYVTAWLDGRDFVTNSDLKLNISEETATANVRVNIAKDYKTCSPHDRQDKVIMLVAGGPSMKHYEDEIVRRRLEGELLVTVNGSYNWALERGIVPSATIVCDGRSFNKRFLLPIKERCRYLLASQCDPELLEIVPYEQLWMWNAARTPKAYNLMEEEYEGKPWYPVPGGSTVMLRAFPLLRLLGFYKFEVFGFDSCLDGEEHHAYSQPENDGERIITVTCGNRIFRCSSWMLGQAQEFMEMTRFMGDEIQLIVHGDGLISHIINTGAELEDAETLV